MITVTIFRNESGEYRGFRSEGHAGYDDPGYDIFCAAVSVLTINAANSIEKFTEDSPEETEREGFLEVHFPEKLSPEGSLFMDSLVLGIRSIAEGEGKPYVRLLFEEE